MSILRKGSQGEAVTALQEQLNALSVSCDIDGIFGPGTEKAVKHFQTAYGLDADGVAGPKTLALLDEEVGKLEGESGTNS